MEYSPGVQSLDITWDGTLREKQSLHFYCVISAPELSGYLDIKFWQRLLPQATQLDQAIKHAVAAIGASHEHQLRKQASRHNSETDGLHPFAIRQCNKAIKDLIRPSTSNKMSQHELMRALTASILFASFESLSGNREGAVPHVVYSRRLLEQYKSNLRDFNGSHRSDSFPVDLDIIEPLVAHYEVQVGGYIFESNPDGMIYTFDPNAVPEFRTLSDARVPFERATASLGMVCWSLEDDRTPEAIASAAEKKQQYSAWLQRWDTAFSAFLAKNSATFDKETIDGCRLLKAHHEAVTTLAEVDYAQGEKGWAVFTTRYQAVVDLISAIIENMPKRGVSTPVPQAPYLSSTMGMTEPLYCAATRCTDPEISERARALMRKLPQSEGIHSSWRTEFIEKTLCAATGKYHTPSPEISGRNTPIAKTED